MLRLRLVLQYNYIYIIFLGLALITALIRINFVDYKSKYDLNTNVIEGVITECVKHDDKYKLTIKSRETVKGTFFTENDLNLKLGMKVRAEGELYKPINNTIPNTFNYKKYLNNKGMYYQIKISNIEILEKKVNINYQLKNYLYKKIDKYQYTKEYLKTFILGDKVDLDDEVYADYQTNGIAHLFAISGMHINLLVFVILFFLNKTKLNNYTKYFGIIILLICYFLLTNYSASLIRSLIFFILVTINKLYDFDISTKNILFLTLSLLIFINPFIIYDIGFQYSALVTYGLIISSNKKRSNYFYKLLITSAYAFLFSLPITLMNFYEINFLGIIYNLLFAPLISFIIYPLSFVVLFLKFLEPLLYLLIRITELINSGLSNIDLFKLIIPKVSVFFYLVYYILLIFYFYSYNKKFLILSLLMVFSFKLKYYLDFNTYVYFIDVGQGDSALIYDNKEAILIDTGGVYNYTISNNTLIFMKSLGIAKIDLLLLTHGDSDHIKDAPNIINKMNVKNVMLNSNEITELEQLVLKLEPKTVTEYKSKFDFTIYNNYVGKDENSSSIISLLKISDYEILFMADAPKEEEALFLKDNPNLIVDIIKLGHHGSKTSSDYNFLDKIKVNEAIISSGRNNLFKHPSKETIETLNKLAIKYYDTQTSGTIKYTFRHNNYTKMTFPP